MKMHFLCAIFLVLILTIGCIDMGKKDQPVQPPAQKAQAEPAAEKSPEGTMQDQKPTTALGTPVGQQAKEGEKVDEVPQAPALPQ